MKDKENEQKEKEERHKKREERQVFCTFCMQYQNTSAYFCHLFKCWIRVDNANLVFLQGASQEEVEAIAKDGKTKGTAIVESYPTKTRMFQELETIQLLKIKIGEEEERKKTKELETNEKEKKMAEEKEMKMAEEEEKKSEEMREIFEWQERKQVSSDIIYFLKEREKRQKEWQEKARWERQKWEEENEYYKKSKEQMPRTAK